MKDLKKDFVTVAVVAAVAEYTRDSGTWQSAEKLHAIRMVPGRNEAKNKFWLFSK